MAKSKTQRAAKADKPATHVKTAVTLTLEEFKQLNACSVKEATTRSRVVGHLISTNCSGYVVSMRGQGIYGADVPSSDSASPADGVSAPTRLAS
jgi:hypothetical protein